jgi:pantetheine-phosphate adenylyltransferase
MKKAIYAGSFDPLTNGHMWLIDRGTKLFDELIIAIGDNPSKKYMFSLNERIAMLEDSLAGYSNITIDKFSGDFLVNYAKKINVNYIIRGIRNSQDYEFEKMLCHVNNDICIDIETLYMIAPREVAEISSSLIKGFIGTNQWQEVVAKYVPENVLNRIINKNGQK